MLGHRVVNPSERQFLFNGRLPYTTCNEDTRAERAALKVSPSDRVLSITASGFRTLNLLEDGAERVVSIDRNPLQSHLLDLKLRAMEHLDYDRFAEFVGLRDGTKDGRLATYRQVRPDLSPAAAAFWDANTRTLQTGLLFSGAHEHFYNNMARLLSVWRPRLLRQIYEAPTLEDQVELYERWDSPMWRRAIGLFMDPRFIRLGLGDRSYHAFAERDGGPGRYVLDRLRQFAHRSLLRDSHFLSLVCYGRYVNDTALPLVLSPTGYADIRRHAHKVEIVTADLGEYLRACPDDSFDKLSLSDITGWMTQEQFQTLMAEVSRATRTSGRVCYRSFAVDRTLPERPAQPEPPSLVRLTDVEQEAEQVDTAFVYEMRVYDVV